MENQKAASQLPHSKTGRVFVAHYGLRRQAERDAAFYHDVPLQIISTF